MVAADRNIRSAGSCAWAHKFMQSQKAAAAVQVHLLLLPQVALLSAACPVEFCLQVSQLCCMCCVCCCQGLLVCCLCRCFSCFDSLLPAMKYTHQSYYLQPFLHKQHPWLCLEARRCMELLVHLCATPHTRLQIMLALRVCYSWHTCLLVV